MIVDMLSDGDGLFGVELFDELQRGQKLFALYRVGRALLAHDEPAPELTAYIEATVAVIYEFALSQIRLEIEDLDLEAKSPTWREMVVSALHEMEEDFTEVPAVKSPDMEEWRFVLEVLQGLILWDNDFEMQESMDVDPQEGRRFKQVLGVSQDYYTAVPPDLPDLQCNLYIDALRGLTPKGRA